VGQIYGIDLCSELELEDEGSRPEGVLGEGQLAPLPKWKTKEKPLPLLILRVLEPHRKCVLEQQYIV